MGSGATAVHGKESIFVAQTRNHPRSQLVFHWNFMDNQINVAIYIYRPLIIHRIPAEYPVSGTPKLSGMLFFCLHSSVKSCFVQAKSPVSLVSQVFIFFRSESHQFGDVSLILICLCSLPEFSLQLSQAPCRGRARSMVLRGRGNHRCLR